VYRLIIEDSLKFAFSGVDISTRDIAKNFVMPQATVARALRSIKKANEDWFHITPNKGYRMAPTFKVDLGPEPDWVKGQWEWLREHRSLGWEWDAEGLELLDPALAKVAS
jgi:hypothetical protein